VLGVVVFAPMAPGLAVRGAPNSNVDEVPFAAVVPFVMLGPKLMGGGFFFAAPERPSGEGWFGLMEVLVGSSVGLLGGGAGRLSALLRVDGVPAPALAHTR
jgi:hypothetical protein